MPRAWRIVKRRHARTAFDGEGARRFPGRWNSPGVPMVYLGDSRALALLEVLVHYEDDQLVPDYVRFEIEYDERDRARLEAKELPRGWAVLPAPGELARIGDRWVARRDTLLLSVPSVIVPEERVLLLNPRHARASELRIRGPKAVSFDPRLAGRRR